MLPNMNDFIFKVFLITGRFPPLPVDKVGDFKTVFKRHDWRRKFDYDKCKRYELPPTNDDQKIVINKH